MTKSKLPSSQMKTTNLENSMESIVRPDDVTKVIIHPDDSINVIVYLDDNIKAFIRPSPSSTQTITFDDTVTVRWQHQSHPYSNINVTIHYYDDNIVDSKGLSHISGEESLVSLY
jgi:hypothetical protein